MNVIEELILVGFTLRALEQGKHYLNEILPLNYFLFLIIISFINFIDTISYFKDDPKVLVNELFKFIK